MFTSARTSPTRPFSVLGVFTLQPRDRKRSQAGAETSRLGSATQIRPPGSEQTVEEFGQRFEETLLVENVRSPYQVEGSVPEGRLAPVHDHGQQGLAPRRLSPAFPAVKAAASGS